MLLDQQIPMERAFKAPFDLKERLGGTLDAGAVASMDPDEPGRGVQREAGPPPVPRLDGRSGAGAVRAVVDDYGGDAAAIWNTAEDGKQLLANVKALPGFGEQKARIFVALLGKQLGVRPPGWERAAAPFGETGSFRSVADIDSPESLTKVRQYKQRMKAKAKAGPSPPSPG